MATTTTESSAFHERNTDHGTHSIITEILNQGFIPCEPTEYGRGARLIAPLDCIRERLLPALKERAEQNARRIAAKVLIRAEMQGRWRSPPSLARALCEVLFDENVRRGPLPSLEGREQRREMIEAALCRNEALRFSVLILPRRDTNPAKNDGPSPDLGEVSTLLRLWTIGRAMELVRENLWNERQAIVERCTGVIGISPSEAQEYLSRVLSPTVEDQHSRMLAMQVTAEAIAEAREGREQITRRLMDLGAELARYKINDHEQARAILLSVGRAGRSLHWLTGGLTHVDQRPIHIVAIRDARRYACCRTDPHSNSVHYRDVLGDMVESLQVGDHVRLTSHEELEAEQEPSRLELFLKLREAVFHETFSAFIAPLERVKEQMLSARSREELLSLLRLNDPSGKLIPLFEAILHTRYHPALENFPVEQGDDGRAFRINFMSRVYEPQLDPVLEDLRRELVWASVVGTAEYVASYESNSGAGNKFGLDDVEFLVPGSIRLSIHKKGEHCKHFTIQSGPSIHRTPWHGTAAVRQSSKGYSLSLECRLGLELKYEGYVPVFLSKHSENRDDSRSTGPICRLDNRREWVELGSMLGTAQNEQPFFWLEPALATSLAAQGCTTGERVVGAIIQRELKL